MRTPIIGVIGASETRSDKLGVAKEIGRGIATRGWMLVTGGLGGVMEAASKGAREAGGTVIGILPTSSTADANPYVTIPIATNMGHARNAIIAHTADVLVAIGGGYGTLSEIALANKMNKKVFGFDSWDVEGVEDHPDPEAVLSALDALLSKR